MTMRSPIIAMLWENWQLTRLEAAQRLALGLVVGAAAMLLPGAGATAAFWALILLHGMFVWLSILKLNGGRFMDGYKPGFPFYLLYTRPVPTRVAVGVAMAYDAITCAALYLVSAALLGFVFDQPLPLFSMILWIFAFHLAYTCIQWSTPNRVVQWGGSFALHLPLFFLLKHRAASPLQVEFSLIENGLMILICVLSFAFTVVGVARQRRGDAVASVSQPAGSGVYPNWLVNLFRFPCPSTSATRAQVWFELKSSGLPVLAIGSGVAVLVFLLFAISIVIAPARVVAVGVAFLAFPILLLNLGSNAFGIRRKQSRAYASTFELTQPYGTPQLAILKVLVRTACVLAALGAIGFSVWASSALIGDWGQWWLADGKHDALPKLLLLRTKIEAAFLGMTGYAQAALAVTVSIAVAGLVAWQAAREAFRVSNPRLLLVMSWLPVLWGVSIALAALAGTSGLISRTSTVFIVLGMVWLATAAIVLATIYLIWSGLAGRSLTARHVCGAFLAFAVLGTTWITVLQAGGTQLAQMPVSSALSMLWPALLPLLSLLGAPWSLNRVRHI